MYDPYFYEINKVNCNIFKIKICRNLKNYKLILLTIADLGNFIAINKKIPSEKGVRKNKRG